MLNMYHETGVQPTYHRQALIIFVMVFLLLLGSVTWITPVMAAHQATLRINNRSSLRICYVYIADTNVRDWGNDRLGRNDIIYQEETYQFPLTAGNYKVLLEDCSHETLMFERNIRVSGTKTLYFHGTSTLTRRDVPPPGVEAQLSLAGTGGARNAIYCSAKNNQRVSTSSCKTEVTDTLVLTFDSRVSRISVTRPDGKRYNFTNNDDSFDLYISPGVLLGTYYFEAIHGSRRVTGSFWVSEASRPTIVVLPRRDRVGSTFEIHLAGYPAYEKAKLHIYYEFQTGRPPDYITHEYVTTLTSNSNQRGEGILTLNTNQNDPLGTYVLRDDTYTQPNHVFRITR